LSVKGLDGKERDQAGLLFEKSIARILFRSSEGGAAWGNRFKRSTRRATPCRFE